VRKVVQVDRLLVDLLVDRLQECLGNESHPFGIVTDDNAILKK
jgi:hypothetical protein